MKNLLRFLLFVLIISVVVWLLSGCRSVKTTTKEEAHIEQEVKEVIDTTHYVITHNVFDTTHVVLQTNEKTQVVEYFDPQTGNLLRRVTDSEKANSLLQDRIQSQQSTIDSLQSQIDRLSKTSEDNKQQVKESKKPPNFLLIGGAIFILVVLVVLVWLKFKIKVI